MAEKLDAKTCPNCSLINPASAQRCDCGFDFVSSTVEQPYLEQPSFQELPSLPDMSVGYIIAAALLIIEVFEALLNPSAPDGATLLSSLLWVTWLIGLAYWLFCVERIHTVLRKATNGRYPISPGAAVGYHFIPAFNLYWILKWPNEIARFVNTRSLAGHMPLGLTGFFLLVGLVARAVDGAIALAIMFSVGLYITRSVDAALRADAVQP